MTSVQFAPQAKVAGTLHAPVPPTGQHPGHRPSCAWLTGCDRPAVDHGLCATHALKCADLIAEHERGDLEDES